MWSGLLKGFLRQILLDSLLLNTFSQILSLVAIIDKVVCFGRLCKDFLAYQQGTSGANLKRESFFCCREVSVEVCRYLKGVHISFELNFVWISSFLC